MKPEVLSGNGLLALVSADVQNALNIVPVQLQADAVLEQPGAFAPFVYFPVSAVVSVISTMKDGATAEVALIGREGMVGLAGVLGTVGGPTRAVVQISGLAFRLGTPELRAARARFGDLREVLDRYTETHIIQTAQTAACNGLHSVEARLSRWLLSIADRTDRDRFRLSQELIAQMLGIQRPTVSVTMQRLQQLKAVKYDGRTIVVDRSRLEPIACECYSMLRQEFARLRRPSLDAVASQLIAARSDHGDGESSFSIETLRQIAGRLLLANIREQEAREAAETANRAKDQFVEAASRELRTPLHAILGWCTILLGPGQDATECGVRIIQQNAAAQLKLVEDLLDVVRLATSTLTIEPSVVQLSPIVQDAIETARPAADDKQVALRLAIVDEPPPLLADAARLRQVFLNVVTNAVRFTEQGGSVDVSVDAAAGGVRVIVRDTGRGIAAAMLPHVFERFKKGAPSMTGGSEGLGLGLTIAQSLVELHGGRIHMASPGDGLGTTCTIELPIAHARASAHQHRDGTVPR